MQILLINQRMVCNVHLFDEKLSHCQVEINMTRKWFVFVLQIIHFWSKFCVFYTTRLYGFMETFILCCHDMTSLLISHTTFCRSVNLFPIFIVHTVFARLSMHALGTFLFVCNHSSIYSFSFGKKGIFWKERFSDAIIRRLLFKIRFVSTFKNETT